MSHPRRADLSSSGSSPASFSQVMVGVSVGSCFTLHSNTTDRPLWTTLYSGCFRILVGSEGKIRKRFRGSKFTKYSNRMLEIIIGENCSAVLCLLPFVSKNVGYFSDQISKLLCFYQRLDTGIAQNGLPVTHLFQMQKTAHL